MNIRCKFKKKEEDIFFAKTLDRKEIRLKCTPTQSEDLDTFIQHIQENNIFNLLNTKENEDGSIEAEFIIFEPDYLMDISSLAENFRSFGEHPLNCILSRFRPTENTHHILLGNAANYFLDEIVNEKDDNPLIYNEVLKKLFKISPFEFTTCKDLQNKETEAVFFRSCEKQFLNIQKIVNQVFIVQNIDKEKAILEPSFICNALGLQGRLDFMLQDFSAFIELKSGKGEEDFYTKQFKYSAINHYIQMILYLAVLEFNMNLSHENVKSYLLYSKYPLLSKERHSRKHLERAITLRNAFVALEYDVQRQNTAQHSYEILKSIKPEILNTKKLSGKFYENYLLPPIRNFGKMLSGLSDLERAYFMRVYTFIVKEMWTAKLGEREYEGFREAANLWNASFEEKISAGELLYDLKIVQNAASSDQHYIVFSIPAYDLTYLPNFRVGDAIVLYERNSENDMVNNKQIFKGAIEEINSKTVKIRLRARQRNNSILPETSAYGIEHDYPDSTFTAMFKGLTAFANANQDRKDLLLLQRSPEIDNSFLPLISSEKEDLKRVMLKADAAKDCFLLIGPPGTGKTSQALKAMVISSLKKENFNILLLAYTNRAVDEICQALHTIDKNLSYIRIGNELNCDAMYRPHLLDNLLKKCNRRSDVIQLFEKERIIVGTVASVWNKPDLFNIKHFDMAIIDEATQLLEPHLLGILSSKDSSGRNAVEKYILIGDHKQLPAIVLQSEEESRIESGILNPAGLFNLKDSLFERLYRKYKEQNLSYTFDMLTKQGRMHPEIAEFPSKVFYNGELNCLGLSHQQDSEQINRMSFIPSFRSPEDISDKINHEEARIIVAIVNDIYSKNKDFDPGTIGIITPYRSQIALIRKKLLETGINTFSSIMIDTVERYQGSQKDIIIYSFSVNTEWQLKALPCILDENGTIIDRKLNVVLTRARKLLFVTGNPELLKKNGLFKKLIEHISS